ncbi:MAG: ATP-binding protein [Phascolarctobacterium sp.]
MVYINRAMEQTFIRMSNQFKVVLLTGPRQVGKTTMLKKLAMEEDKKREYVSLDDINERNLAKNDPKLFLQLHKPPVFIDEVQYAPELFPYIKIYVDEHQSPGDFWLTGSQIFKLMEGVQESLAGRVCLLHMSPLSQSEIYDVPSEPFSVDLEHLLQRNRESKGVSIGEIYKCIWQGGMPALLNGTNTEHDAVYGSYISTYIDRDVREIADKIDSLKFLRFITATSAIAGQMLNYKTIADLADISVPTVKNWLNILERLGIIFYLHPFANNLLKRMVSKPKLYFYDCGLVCYLTKWQSPETLLNGAMSGAILENFVVSEIVKSYQNAGKTTYIYYYRDKDNKEIDIVLESDGGLYPLEVKRTSTPDVRLTKVFSLLDKASLERRTGGIICLSDRLSAFDSQNLIIPVSLI